MTLDVVTYRAAEHEALWDEWCARSINATFLHTRRFLAYHAQRFQDNSALLLRDGRLAGVVPAATMPDRVDAVGSHPGATYGGIVHDGALTGERTIEAVEVLKRHYRQAGFRTLVYKAVPWPAAASPSQDDLYALFRHDARRVGCNLACVVDVIARRAPAERRRRGLRKALRTVEVESDVTALGEVFDIIADNLARRHEARPVHSRDELLRLVELFPQNVRLRAARIEGRVEAGVILFNTPRVWRAQYIGSSERGFAASALDAVLEDAIAGACEAGARYFDFGTSNSADGRVLNDGLYRFKAEFGGGGVVHEIYELDL